MNPEFDPRVFLAKLNAGVFNGRLNEAIHELSPEQLEKVAVLMAQTLRRKGSPKE